MRIDLKNEILAKIAVMSNNENVTVSFLLEKIITFYQKNKANKGKSNKHQKSENRPKILACLTVPKFQSQISSETGINLSTVKTLVRRMLKVNILRKGENGYQSV